MPRFTIPEGVKVAEAFTDFKSNLRTSYGNRANDYLAELYPGLTYDPKQEARCRRDRERARARRPTAARSVTIEGMPIGLFENEVTVQLWKPVTIRGYTFNVGDNSRSTRPRSRRRPRSGAISPGCMRPTRPRRTGSPFEVVLEPAAAAPGARGEQGPDPLVDGVPERPVCDPAGGPVADAAVPLRQVGTDRRPTRPTSWPTTSPPVTGPSSPISRSPSRTPATWTEQDKAHPELSGGGLADDDHKASPCLQCHAIGQYKPTGGEAGRQWARPPAGRAPVPARLPGGLDRQPAATGPVTRRCPRTSRRTASVQIPVPKTFENKPFEMVQAIRDTLLNYVNAVELQLASSNTSTNSGAMPANSTQRPPRRRARRLEVPEFGRGDGRSVELRGCKRF